jgi:drug/metabolite transporter (DMT)-like permease
VKRRVWAAFGLFCVLSGSTWMLAAVFAFDWPPLLRLGFHDAVVCLLLSAAGLALRKPARWRALVSVAGWGAVLLAGPELLSAGAGGRVGATTQVTVLGITPVLTVLLRSQAEEGTMRRLMPAVLAVGGLALVIPVAWPTSLAGADWLAGMLAGGLCLAYAGIRLYWLLQEVPLLWAAAAASAGAALAGGMGALLSGEFASWSRRRVLSEAGWGVAVDTPLLLLMIWLLRRMEPVGFSSRFVLVPVVTILSAIMVTRPEVGWTGWLGLTIAAVAGVVLGSGRGGSAEQEQQASLWRE